MSTDIKLSDEQIARLGYDAWNDRDYDRGAALFAENGEIVNVPLGTTYRGRDGYLQFVRGWAASFPDGKIEIRNVVAASGSFAVEFTAHGTDAATRAGLTDRPRALLRVRGG